MNKNPPTGLSPRVRGSRLPQTLEPRDGGSIPACAGEPLSSKRHSTSSQVYPRVCGGAANPAQIRERIDGLSPRVRGSLFSVYQPEPRLRSIPACAGEPTRPLPSTRKCQVYPRVCGGASTTWTVPHDQPGLSPRVRGSHRGFWRHRDARGSIPACAGEPRFLTEQSARERVYPRVCGGADGGACVGETVRGLSPRVRGSPASSEPAISRRGSIPACAGEPR